MKLNQPPFSFRSGVGVLLLAGLSMCWPGAAASADSAHEQFVFAYKLMQRGDTAEAAAEFDRYLRDYPAASKRTDAAYYRALLFREAGDAGAAARLLSGIEAGGGELVPSYAVSLLRGQTLVDVGRFQEALAVLGEVEIGGLDSSLALSVRYLRGQAARSAQEFGLAAQELSAAADLAEAQGHALKGPVLVELAEAQRSRGDLDAAARALERALAGQADEAWGAQAARLSGDVAYERGEMDAAVRAYRRVLDDFPGSEHYGPAVVGTLWALYSAERDLEVVETFARLAETLPLQDRVAAHYLAGSSEQRRGNHEAAVAALEPVSRGNGMLPLEERVLYRLAVSRHALEQDDQVIATVARLNAQFPDSQFGPDAAFLAASSRSRMGDAAAGVAELSRFVEAGPDGPRGAAYFLRALRQRAALYASQGRLEPAIADYTRYFDVLSQTGQVDAASELPVLWAYGDALQQAGRDDAALAQFAGAVTVLEEEREQGKPLTTLEPEGYYRAGSAFAASGQDAEALRAFDTLVERYPLDALSDEAALMRGAVLRRLGRDGDALRAWIDAADREGLAPSQRALALRAAAGVYRSAGRGEDAAVTLGRALAIAGPENLVDDELLWLAERWLDRARGGETANDSLEAQAALNEAERLLDTLDASSRRPTAVQRSHRLYLGGRLALRLGELDAATEQFGRVLALSEGFDLDAQLGLAEIAEARGDLEAAREEYDGLTRAEETSVAARAMLRLGHVEAARAASMLRQGRQREAVDAQAAARRTWKRLALLYLDAEALQPTPQLALIALGELAASMGESAVAAREYGELAEAFPKSPWGRYAAAAVAGRYEGRPDDALAMLRGLLEGDGAEALDASVREKAEALRLELEGRP
ncbi:MAG: tetratricopeptide repeat protein [Planctomycetota bacterium]